MEFDGVLEEAERGIGNQDEATLSPNLSFHFFLWIPDGHCPDIEIYDTYDLGCKL